MEGGEADQARAALRDLAQALRDTRFVRLYGTSLSRGVAGIAVLFAYLALDQEDGRIRVQASEYLRLALDSDETTASIDLTLYGGLTGIAWTVEHLTACGVFDDDATDWCQSVDTKLGQRLQSEPWRGPYDVVNGLAGFALYALERNDRAASGSTLRLIVKRLAEIGARSSNHPAWWTSPAELSEEQRRDYPLGYWDLGLAHGLPGAISVLSRLVAAGIEFDSTRPLLEGAGRFLLDQGAPEAQDSTFGTKVPVIDESEEPPRRRRARNSRLAWCYGELGIAAALFAAAVQLKTFDWQSDAVAIARRAATRALADSGVVDGGMCHGSAGVAHLFNRFYQATRESVFRDAARFWYLHTLTFYRRGTGVGGFSAWRPFSVTSQKHWCPWPGLLEGSAGIGLALLAATTPVEPVWDRVLALSLPLAAHANLHPREA